MSILAIETASQVSGVAVQTDGKLAAELLMQGRLTHSETLLPHIETVLQMAGQEKKNVSAVAVSIGPGSFTGLRIGLAAAKALSYAWEVPLYGISTLQALAFQIPVPGITLLPMMDAQKGNAYVQAFRYNVADNNMKAVADLAVKPVSEVLEEAGEMAGPVVLLGDALRKIKKESCLPQNVMLAPAHLRMPRASCVAAAAERRMAGGKPDHAMNLEPLYIRRSEAEVLWEKRHSRQKEQEAGK